MERGGAVTRSTRAVSPVFAYTLTLAVTTLLIAGLFIAAGGYVTAEREAVAENELEVIGQQLSADIAAADRLSRTSGATDARIERQLPRTVVGATYTVEVLDRTNTGEGPTEIYLELQSKQPDVTVQIGVSVVRDVKTGSVGGGTVVVEYDDEDEELQVYNG